MKFKCWFGFHDWTEPTTELVIKRRECKCCGKKQYFGIYSLRWKDVIDAYDLIKSAHPSELNKDTQRGEE